MTFPEDKPEWLNLRSNIYLRDKGICWVCNSFVQLSEYDLGHLIDRCMGGQDVFDNLVVMHKRCNVAKPPHVNLDEAVKWKLTLNYKDLSNHNTSLKLDGLSSNKVFTYIHNPKPMSEYKLSKLKPLTITWVQGKARWLLPPREDGTYHKEDKFAVGSRTPVPGCTKYVTGINSASASLEIIGRTSETIINETKIDLGIFFINISQISGGELKMNIVLNRDKANIIGINRYSNQYTH